MGRSIPLAQIGGPPSLDCACASSVRVLFREWMSSLSASPSLSFSFSATLFDRDRAFVDSDFGVFHDSSGAAAIDAMGRPIGREMKGGSEEEDTRQPNGILLFALEEASLVDFRVALSSQRTPLFVVEKGFLPPDDNQTVGRQWRH